MENLSMPRATTSLMCVVALAGSILLLAPAESANAAPTPEPRTTVAGETTRVTLNLAKAQSLQDAAGLAAGLEEPVLALTFQNDGVEGEFALNGLETADAFTDGFEANYGTTPRVTGLVVERPVDSLTDQARSLGSSTEEVIPVSGEEFVAEPVDLSPALSAQFDNKADGLRDQSRVAADPIDWRPNDAQF